MRKSLLILVLLLGVILVFSGLSWTAQKEAKEDTVKVKAAAKPVFGYVGATVCKPCHNLPKTGKQFDMWMSKPHAQAYKTLANEQSIALAKKMKIADAQKSEKCLKCHITAFGVPDSLLGEKYSVDEGVTCEACHGPGEKYKSMKIMKDKELALKNGLIEPTEELCVTCHNEESPTYKPFKYAEKVKAIDHSYPPPVEEKK
jgi:Zn finger protein HypA/HybF involved in hydrogenase expression